MYNILLASSQSRIWKTTNRFTKTNNITLEISSLDILNKRTQIYLYNITISKRKIVDNRSDNYKKTTI